MEKADESAVDPVRVQAGSGSDVDGEADIQGNSHGTGAPQSYQHPYGPCMVPSPTHAQVCST